MITALNSVNCMIRFTRVIIIISCIATIQSIEKQMMSFCYHFYPVYVQYSVVALQHVLKVICYGVDKNNNNGLLSLLPFLSLYV